MTDPTPAPDAVAQAAPKVEAKAEAAVATVAADAKAVGSAVSGAWATVKKYAPHVATASAGYVAGHYTGAIVFGIIKHIV